MIDDQLDQTKTSRPEVGVVVVPRERWSGTEEVVERLVAATPTGLPGVVVAAGMPSDLITRVRALIEPHGWLTVEVDRYLPPNHCRQLGLDHLPTTDRVAFVDNDVLLEDGWLAGLMACMDVTGAAAVMPLMLEDNGTERVVHLSRGRMWEERVGDRTYLRTEHEHQKRPRADAVVPTSRVQSDFVEFHAVLVDRAGFDLVGGLDLALTGSREHLDLSLRLRAAGYELWVEPSVSATYSFGSGIRFSDWSFFRTRWSERWIADSHEAFHAKFGYANPVQERLRSARWRRSLALSGFRRRIRPFIGNRPSKAVVLGLIAIETPFNRLRVKAPTALETIEVRQSTGATAADL